MKRTFSSNRRRSSQTSKVFKTPEVFSATSALGLALAMSACWLLVDVSAGAEPAPNPASVSSPLPRSAAASDLAIPAKVRRYAERLLRHYDRNGDGVLQPDEWSKMHGKPAAIDANGDRTISLDELTRYLVAYGQQRHINLASPDAGWNPDTSAGGAAVPSGDRGQDGAPLGAPPEGDKTLSAGASDAGGKSPRKPRESTFYVRPSRLPAGLPDWFVGRDLDGDGQISLSEFAPNPTKADLEEFARYDKNGDGFITARECLDALRPARPAARKSVNKSAGKSGEKSTSAKANETGGAK